MRVPAGADFLRASISAALGNVASSENPPSSVAIVSVDSDDAAVPARRAGSAMVVFVRQ
jgi:hypothetical protein